MREIKFRAWLPEGEWNDEGTEQEYVMVHDLAFEEYAPINDLLAGVDHLMQSTGLHDKNGVEIFEGDICTFYRGQSHEVGPYTVKWNPDHCGFHLYLPHEEITTYDCGPHRTGIEVIGNIHENPELLEASGNG